MKFKHMVDDMLAIPDNPYGPEFFQIGVYCESPMFFEWMITELSAMGYDEWTFDVAKHCSEVINPGNPIDWYPIRVDAHMAFNYQIVPGKEFELMYWALPKMTPIGPHPYEHLGGVHRACLTYKVESTFTEEERLWEQFSMRPMYRFVSYRHENPAIKGKARYRDTTYDTYSELGYDLRFTSKLIHHTFFVTNRGAGSELNWIMWNEMFKTDYPLPPLLDNDWYAGCGRECMTGKRVLWTPPEHQDFEDEYVTGVQYDSNWEASDG